MGKIERINLRGISRSPSDRMLTDGGCAESLNVQLDHNEIVPMPEPKNVTDDVFSDYAEDVTGARALYIHKGTYYTNYIFACDEIVENSTNRSYAIYANVNGNVSKIASFEYDPSEVTVDQNNELASVTSVGNTLVISFNGEMRYVLFKYGQYKPLGERIPVPKVRFYMKNSHYEDAGGTDHINERNVPTVSYATWESTSGRFRNNQEFTEMIPGTDDYDLIPGNWGKENTGYKVTAESQLAVLNGIIDSINTNVATAAKAGEFYFPLFIRYALRLYDGTLYSCSAPILIGADLEKYVAIGLHSHKSNRETAIRTDGGNHVRNVPIYYVASSVSLPAKYSIVADFTNETSFSSGDWEDIIEGLEIYSSTPFLPYSKADRIMLSNRETSGEDDYETYYKAEATLDPEFTTREKIESHQITYFLKKWEYGELHSLAEEDLSGGDFDFSSDNLSAQSPMIDSESTIHAHVGKKLSSYNNRLLLEGQTIKLYPGYPFINSTKLADADSVHYVCMLWHLRIDGEEHIVQTVSPTGSTSLPPIFTGEKYEQPIAWFSYPDARAFAVDICYLPSSESSSRYRVFRSFPLRSFAGIDAAYYFYDFGKSIIDAVSDGVGNPMNSSGWDVTLDMINEKVVLNDQISLSKSSNPFAFPEAGVVDFDEATVYGTGMVTKALSQGQFGQFPLYVFTSSGIWALGLNSEGTLISKHAVSRDVAIEGTISPIDQAIVFTTKKGVMMLSGSDIQNISPDMNGKHYTIEQDASELLSEHGHTMVASAASDSESFLDFMENAKSAYDYAGQRLLFGSKEEKEYMYVYRLSTGTWHKTTIFGWSSDERPFRVVNLLNSYPNAILSTYIDEYSYAYDFSTLLDYSESQSEPSQMREGLIATRPIDFGLPDIYKSVTRVKIRGEVDRSNNHSPFKYILLGSNDGVNWAMLHSLRGPSFKLFRLIILTTLNSTERISYAEIEYEPRFTNKIR